jgi:hypothetical protein
MYSCTLSLTSALEGVACQRHAPAALPPGKIRYPLYRRLGGPQCRSVHERKISPSTGIRSQDPLPIVQEAGWASVSVCTCAENLALHWDSIPRSVTHCTGGWVGLRVGLYMSGKSRSPLGFDPRPNLAVHVQTSRVERAGCCLRVTLPFVA